MSYTLPAAVLGYNAGAVLRDVTLAEARAWECNRCGDCCNGLAEDVKRDPESGFPLFTWGSKYPGDLYESRYGRRLLLPIVEHEGQLQVGDAFERDPDGKPYTCFACAFHEAPQGGGPTTCTLLRDHPQPDPERLEQVRPLNCGEFPVFSTAVDDAIIGGHPFVPATGALPRCEWYGLRIVGPWRDTPYWRDRWERQQRGEPVPELSIPLATVQAIADKQEARRRRRHK